VEVADGQEKAISVPLAVLVPILGALGDRSARIHTNPHGVVQAGSGGSLTVGYV
jgi:hypothetical protein